MRVIRLDVVDSRIAVIPRWGGGRHYCATAQTLTAERLFEQGEPRPVELQGDKVYYVYYTIPNLKAPFILELGTYYKGRRKEVYQAYLLGVVLEVHNDHLKVLEF